MILQALVNHYENLAEQGKVDQEGWCKAKVSYAVNLSKDGEILGIFSLKTEEERGEKESMAPSADQGTGDGDPIIGCFSEFPV